MVTPNAGRMTTSAGVERVQRLARVGQEADPLRPELVVDVRVVDDFAGEEDAAVGKSLPRLVGVVDRAIDAVAEPELTRQVDGEPAGAEAVAVLFDGADDLAVIALGEHVGDLVFEVEPFPEDKRRH